MGNSVLGRGRRALDILRWGLLVLLPAGVWRPVAAAMSHRVTDRRLDPWARQVIEAAAILEVSEYDVLSMAFREHFGRSPRTGEIGRIFGPYMFDGTTPNWAAALAEEVIDLYDRDQLARSRFHSAARPRTLRDVVIGIGQSVLIVVLFGLIYLFLTPPPPPL